MSVHPDNLAVLLNSLGDGEFHSGEELGDLLGVSRTAVWKHLKKLEPLGLGIESVKGKGYCLSGGLELLDAEQIHQGLAPASLSLLRNLELLLTIDSTNAHALRAATGSGFACLAEQQLQGRGRRGRAWVSPFGRNIYLSVAWHFDGGAAALEGLSLAVGVAVVKALESLGLRGMQLKWPNDVLFEGRKLAGVLLEMTGDVSGACKVVIGVGLNVSMPDVSAESIDQPWIDIGQIVRSLGLSPVGRNQVVAALLNHLLPLLSGYQVDGFERYLPQWGALDAFAGKAVELRSGSRLDVGIAVGVTSTGALRLRMGDGGECTFNGGEVSLRAVENGCHA